MLSVGSTFAGIGGIDLGLEATGAFRTAWTSEVKPAAGRVLAHRFPHAEPLGSVTDLLSGMFGNAWPVDLACGGPPCQDLSIGNGNRAGLAGDRSGLFLPWAEALAELRPRWLVMEQVTGLLTFNGGRDYALVRQTLERIGYDLAIVAHNSRAYVPQVRSRLYVVGCLEPGAAGQAVLPLRADGARDPDTYRATGWRLPGPAAPGARVYRKSRRPGNDTEPESWVDGHYANTLTLHDTGHVRASVLVVDDAGVRILTPVEWERCHGFPDDWTVAAGSDQDRYECLGNAVSPPVAHRIGQGIAAVEQLEVVA